MPFTLVGGKICSVVVSRYADAPAGKGVVAIGSPSFGGTGSSKQAAMTRQKRFCGFP